MNNNKKARHENRIAERIPAESGTTVIIHSGDQEIIGTIENKSETGLGLIVSDNSRQYLEQTKEITVTYSMPYGVVSQQAKICWTKSEKTGELRVGAANLEQEKGLQTNYQKLWKDFTEAEQLEDASGFWLSLQSSMLSGVTCSVVILGKPDSGAYAPISFWPAGQRGNLGLTEVAEQTLQEKRGVLRDDGQFNKELNFQVCHIGYPLLLDNKLYGVVAFEIVVRSEQAMRAVMRQLQWGVAWIELIARRIEGKKYTPENQQLVTVLELIATSLKHEEFHAAATSVATELATLLECERVSLGFLSGKYILVKAMSHSADFAKKSKPVQSIGLAMDEAMDQQITLVFPPLTEEPVRILRCHEKLLQSQNNGGICTIPLCDNAKIIGALTLERPSGKVFTQETVELCTTIASLIGPILEAKRKEDLWLISKAWLSVKEFFLRLLGPAHAVLKLVCASLVALIIFFMVAMGDFRIAADSYLEGAIQRVIVTPFDGYIDEAYARAGDVVKKDMLLVTLDDKDLVLEKAKWASQKEQYLKQYRDALGKVERSKISVLNAQLKQVDVQLAMINSQLERIRIKAPFDGIIVSGDLRQSLGSPSERGEVLFEIAPLNAYRIILEVDERDISDIVVGQAGELVLTGHSDIVNAFKVTNITPVS